MDKLLYFPYITIPQTPWLYKSLLYWDSVDTITPNNYGVFEGNHMKELINNELVNMVYPENYIKDYWSFEEVFIRYVDDRYITNIERYRMTNKNLSIGSLIHTNKMSSIGYELEQRELATLTKDEKWYCIHPTIANDYMFYLATMLGQEVKSQPITDRIANFNADIPFGTQTQVNMMNREELRKIALEGIFPLPIAIENAKEISDFKKKNGEQLKQFRKHIEGELLRIDGTSEHLKGEMIEKLILDIKDEKESISDKMKEKWNVIDSGTLITLGIVETPALIQSIVSGSIAGTVASSMSIIGLVTERLLKVRSNHNEALNNPLAYAFLAEQQLNRK